MTSILEFYSLADREAGISANNTAISLNFNENSADSLKSQLIHAGTCLASTLSEIWDAPVLWRVAHCTDFPDLCHDKDFLKFSDHSPEESVQFGLAYPKLETFDEFSKKLISLQKSTPAIKSIYTEFRGFPVCIKLDTHLYSYENWYCQFGSKLLVTEANTRAEAVDCLLKAMRLECQKLCNC